MHHQWMRLTLVIIMLVVTGTSAFNIFQLEQERRLTLTRAARYESQVASLTLSLAELRASQQAYVANGQDLETWLDRTARVLAVIVGTLDELETRSSSDAALDAIADVRASLDEWREIDARAQGYRASGQPLLASDVVFTEGRNAARRAASHLALAQAVERETRAREQEEQRNAQLTASLAGIGVGMLVALAMFPRSTLEPSGPPPSDVLSTEAGHPNAVTDNARHADPRPAPDAFVPDLAKAATVCSDLARLSEPSKLDRVLARACDVLEASSLIVWVSDAAGGSLRPVGGHGYTPGQLTALGRVASDADNITAAAFRTRKTQVLSSRNGRPGALASPLVAASSAAPRRGCVGVLAVELGQTGETNDAMRATMSILAAQLATLVSVDPVQSDASDAKAHAG